MSARHEGMPPLIWDSVGTDTSPLSYSSKGQDEDAQHRLCEALGLKVNSCLS